MKINTCGGLLNKIHLKRVDYKRSLWYSHYGVMLTALNHSPEVL